MAVTVRIDDSNLPRRLSRIGKDARQALIDAFKPLVASIAADAKVRAASHIRFLGTKPGVYLASIKGGISTKDPDRVTGFVRSKSPLAHLLEFGAHVPAHDILPKVAHVLAFEGSAGRVFARHVHSPGATIPAYPAITPALADARDAIEAAVERVARDLGARS